MKILLTGATGYIGKRLLPVLLHAGHHIVCCVRDINRFRYYTNTKDKLDVIKVDFLNAESLQTIPDDIDAAFYLLHSMAAVYGDFADMESITAENFVKRLQNTHVRQVIYLSGISNEKQLSKHLMSRKKVEDILSSSTFALTTLRAGIIVGSGSASFEIIRDLVEKLPVMIAPKWLNTKSQPIAISNVIEFLTGVLGKEMTFNRHFDIGGPQILTYKEMLLQYARARNLKRKIYTVPVMSPRLSSYWLYFVTSTSYVLARNLVDSMKINVICIPNDLHKQLSINLVPYKQAIKRAFVQIEHDQVISSWKDALNHSENNHSMAKYLTVPIHGCFRDHRWVKTSNPEKVLEKIWAIGGYNGWYHANWLWEIRGFLDLIVGGVGLRRGRKNQYEISNGEALDFWRVLVSDKPGKRLLLFAEMKLPGEAWLEFKIDQDNVLHQTATFRPLGLWGRLYWFLVMPFHQYVFNGMIKKLVDENKR